MSLVARIKASTIPGSRDAFPASRIILSRVRPGFVQQISIIQWANNIVPAVQCRNSAPKLIRKQDSHLLQQAIGEEYIAEGFFTFDGSKIANKIIDKPSLINDIVSIENYWIHSRSLLLFDYCISKENWIYYLQPIDGFLWSKIKAPIVYLLGLSKYTLSISR